MLQQKYRVIKPPKLIGDCHDLLSSFSHDLHHSDIPLDTDTVMAICAEINTTIKTWIDTTMAGEDTSTLLMGRWSYDTLNAIYACTLQVEEPTAQQLKTWASMASKCRQYIMQPGLRRYDYISMILAIESLIVVTEKTPECQQETIDLTAFLNDVIRNMITLKMISEQPSYQETDLPLTCSTTLPILHNLMGAAMLDAGLIGNIDTKRLLQRLLHRAEAVPIGDDAEQKLEMADTSIVLHCRLCYAQFLMSLLVQGSGSANREVLAEFALQITQIKNSQSSDSDILQEACSLCVSVFDYLTGQRQDADSYQAAIQVLKLIISLIEKMGDDQSLSEYQIQLANCFFETKQYPAAAAILQKLIPLRPEERDSREYHDHIITYADCYLLQAQCLASLKRYGEAHEILQLLLNEEGLPFDEAIELNYAEVYYWEAVSLAGMQRSLGHGPVSQEERGQVAEFCQKVLAGMPIRLFTSEKLAQPEMARYRVYKVLGINTSRLMQLAEEKQKLYELKTRLESTQGRGAVASPHLAEVSKAYYSVILDMAAEEERLGLKEECEKHCMLCIFQFQDIEHPFKVTAMRSVFGIKKKIQQMLAPELGRCLDEYDPKVYAALQTDKADVVVKTALDVRRQLALARQTLCYYTAAEQKLHGLEQVDSPQSLESVRTLLTLIDDTDQYRYDVSFLWGRFKIFTASAQDSEPLTDILRQEARDHFRDALHEAFKTDDIDKALAVYLELGQTSARIEGMALAPECRGVVHDEDARSGAREIVALLEYMPQGEHARIAAYQQIAQCALSHGMLRIAHHYFSRIMEAVGDDISAVLGGRKPIAELPNCLGSREALFDFFYQRACLIDAMPEQVGQLDKRLAAFQEVYELPISAFKKNISDGALRVHEIVGRSAYGQTAWRMASLCKDSPDHVEARMTCLATFVNSWDKNKLLAELKVAPHESHDDQVYSMLRLREATVTVFTYYLSHPPKIKYTDWSRYLLTVLGQGPESIEGIIRALFSPSAMTPGDEQAVISQFLQRTPDGINQKALAILLFHTAEDCEDVVSSAVLHERLFRYPDLFSTLNVYQQAVCRGVARGVMGATQEKYEEACQKLLNIPGRSPIQEVQACYYEIAMAARNCGHQDHILELCKAMGDRLPIQWQLLQAEALFQTIETNTPEDNLHCADLFNQLSQQADDPIFSDGPFIGYIPQKMNFQQAECVRHACNMAEEAKFELPPDTVQRMRGLYQDVFRDVAGQVAMTPAFEISVLGLQWAKIRLPALLYSTNNPMNAKCPLPTAQSYVARVLKIQEQLLEMHDASPSEIAALRIEQCKYLNTLSHYNASFSTEALHIAESLTEEQLQTAGSKARLCCSFAFYQAARAIPRTEAPNPRTEAPNPQKVELYEKAIAAFKQVDESDKQSSEGQILQAAFCPN